MTHDNAILGKDGYIEIKIAGEYYPLLCFKAASLNREIDEIEKTSATSSTSREFKPGLKAATLRVSGVSTMDQSDGNVSIMYIMQHEDETFELRMNLTDQSGTNKVIAFQGFTRSWGLDNDVTQWSQSVIDFRISGDVDFGDPEEGPAAPDIYSDYWPVTPGSSSVTGDSAEYGYDMEDITPIAVYRSGKEHDPILSGTPGNLQCRYISATPEIIFDPTNPFNAGETVFVIFTRNA
jgi:hypothetical protein